MTFGFVAVAAAVALILVGSANAQQAFDVRDDIRSRAQVGSYAEISRRYDVAAVPG